jgi:hypothetical protein
MECEMLRDLMLWLLGVPIIAIIAMHLLGILN